MFDRLQQRQRRLAPPRHRAVERHLARHLHQIYGDERRVLGPGRGAARPRRARSDSASPTKGKAIRFVRRSQKREPPTTALADDLHGAETNRQPDQKTNK